MILNTMQVLLAGALRILVVRAITIDPLPLPIPQTTLYINSSTPSPPSSASSSLSTQPTTTDSFLSVPPPSTPTTSTLFGTPLPGHIESTIIPQPPAEPLENPPSNAPNNPPQPTAAPPKPPQPTVAIPITIDDQTITLQPGELPRVGRASTLTLELGAAGRTTVLVAVTTDEAGRTVVVVEGTGVATVSGGAQNTGRGGGPQNTGDGGGAQETSGVARPTAAVTGQEDGDDANETAGGEDVRPTTAAGGSEDPAVTAGAPPFEGDGSSVSQSSIGRWIVAFLAGLLIA